MAVTMHNIQPRAGDNIKDFTAINMWYQRLDERYNFSLGPNILPLMTTGNLTKIITLDPPFMQYNAGFIYQQKYMSSVFGKIYQSTLSFRVIFIFRRKPSPSESPTSLDIKLEFSIYPLLRLQDRPQLLRKIPFSGRDNLSLMFLLPPHNPWGPALLQVDIEQDERKRKEKRSDDPPG